MGEAKKNDANFSIGRCENRERSFSVEDIDESGCLNGSDQCREIVITRRNGDNGFLLFRSFAIISFFPWEWA